MIYLQMILSDLISKTKQFLCQRPDESIPEELRPEDLRQFLHWAEQIADGMEYLTSKKVPRLYGLFLELIFNQGPFRDFISILNIYR